MKNIKSFCLVVFFTPVAFGAPLIQKISNHTDFGFVIIAHSDQSSCSLQAKQVIIPPQSAFTHEFLLEVGTPSVVLRPIFYKDSTSNQEFWLTDSNFEYQPELVQQAYDAWKKIDKFKFYKKTADQWLESWVGKDLFVVPHEVAVRGYLLDLSRVTLHNLKNHHIQWLSFAKGVFATMVLELDLLQRGHRGIAGKISVLHGEGGVCSQGIIERL